MAEVANAPSSSAAAPQNSAAVAQNSADKSKALPAGMLAPKFDLEVVSSKGRGTRLRSDGFGGQFLLLYFWASWCANCQAQSPAIAQISEQFKGKLKVIGINADIRIDIARAAASERAYPFDSVFDHGAVMQTAFRAGQLPTTVIVDPSGRVAYSVKQVVSESALVAEVERSLAGKH